MQTHTGGRKWGNKNRALLYKKLNEYKETRDPECTKS